MCIVFLALGVHPAFPVVVASNRDEFFARPTKRAHHWAEVPLLAGRDELRGGTWLGVARSGRFAVLTNVRVRESELRPSACSRGLLVEQLLSSPLPVAAFLKELEQKQDSFEGFNLLTGDISTMQFYFFSNSSQRTALPLPSGVYALSNGTLTSAWYKTEHGKALFREALASNPSDAFEPLSAALLKLLDDRTRPGEPGKYECGPGSPELEYLCAPICVYSSEKAYGTRASTVIAATKQHVRYLERSLSDPASQRREDSTFEFDIVQ